VTGGLCTFYIVCDVKMHRLIVDMKTDKRGDVYTKSVCNCNEEKKFIYQIRANVCTLILI